jgi:hypothetical protein
VTGGIFDVARCNVGRGRCGVGLERAKRGRTGGKGEAGAVDGVTQTVVVGAVRMKFHPNREKLLPERSKLLVVRVKGDLEYEKRGSVQPDRRRDQSAFSSMDGNRASRERQL